VSLPVPGRWILGLACLLAAPTGCEPLSRDRLLIATSWPSAERRRIETDFVGWLQGHPQPDAHGPIRVEWLILSPGDDLERLATRRDAPDVLLGGPARVLERLAGEKLLARSAGPDSPGWLVVREAGIRLIAATGEDSEAAGSARLAAVAFDDPRRDPVSLAWAEAELGPERFREGYARLVRAAGDRRRIGQRTGSAAAAVGRSEADRAPDMAPPDPTDPETGSIPWVEGVAVLAGARHQDLAASFFQFLAATGRSRPAPANPQRSSSEELGLLADLLGATLVDAQDELWAAWSALERSGSPPNQLRWMTEPPPWPPASIAKILDRKDEPAMAMLETLADQLATDPSVRSWLVRSWLSPARLIDRAVLEDLAVAVEGRVIREPRFREWLRAEWTAWARQRYRRVMRAVVGPPYPAGTGEGTR
jgi:hypothetical protein